MEREGDTPPLSQNTRYLRAVQSFVGVCTKIERESSGGKRKRRPEKKEGKKKGSLGSFPFFAALRKDQCRSVRMRASPRLRLLSFFIAFLPACLGVDVAELLAGCCCWSSHLSSLPPSLGVCPSKCLSFFLSPSNETSIDRTASLLPSFRD